MIKSISYWSMQNGLAGTHPIADALHQARTHGFAGLELCIGLEGELTPTSTQGECEGIREAINNSGVIVQTLASGMSWAFNPTSDDAATRRRAIEIHTAAIRRCAWLGCEAMLFVPGIVKSPIVAGEVIRYDKAIDRAGEAVRQILDVAEEVGVTLCVENVWNGLFYSPLELANFIDSFGSNHLGVYFDVGNVLGYHQHPPHWIELLGPRIRRVHVKDYQETFGSNGRYAFCGLGQGDVPWPATMKALHAVGYHSTLVAEMLPWNQTLLAETSAAMDAILAM